MNTKSRFTPRRIALAGLLAALTAVGSGLRVTLPLDIAGNTSFHLGNILCALSGILLGPGLGGLAAGLGSAIYDMTNPMYLPEAWLTFLMKGALALVAGLVMLLWKKNWGIGKAAAASAAGAVAYALLYLLKSYYKGIFLQGLTHQASLLNLVGKLPATVFNAAVAVIFAPILAVAIRKALEQNRMTLE